MDEAKNAGVVVDVAREEEHLTRVRSRAIPHDHFQHREVPNVGLGSRLVELDAVLEVRDEVRGDIV